MASLALWIGICLLAVASGDPIGSESCPDGDDSDKSSLLQRSKQRAGMEATRLVDSLRGKKKSPSAKDVCKFGSAICGFAWKACFDACMYVDKAFKCIKNEKMRKHEVLDEIHSTMEKQRHSSAALNETGERIKVYTSTWSYSQVCQHAEEGVDGKQICTNLRNNLKTGGEGPAAYCERVVPNLPPWSKLDLQSCMVVAMEGETCYQHNHSVAAFDNCCVNLSKSWEGVYDNDSVIPICLNVDPVTYYGNFNMELCMDAWNYGMGECLTPVNEAIIPYCEGAVLSAEHIGPDLLSMASCDMLARVGLTPPGGMDKSMACQNYIHFVYPKAPAEHLAFYVRICLNVFTKKPWTCCNSMDGAIKANVSANNEQELQELNVTFVEQRKDLQDLNQQLAKYQKELQGLNAMKERKGAQRELRTSSKEYQKELKGAQKELAKYQTMVIATNSTGEWHAEIGRMAAQLPSNPEHSSINSQALALLQPPGPGEKCPVCELIHILEDAGKAILDFLTRDFLCQLINLGVMSAAGSISKKVTTAWEDFDEREMQEFTEQCPGFLTSLTSPANFMRWFAKAKEQAAILKFFTFIGDAIGFLFGAAFKLSGGQTKTMDKMINTAIQMMVRMYFKSVCAGNIQVPNIFTILIDPFIMCAVPNPVHSGTESCGDALAYWCPWYSCRFSLNEGFWCVKTDPTY